MNETQRQLASYARRRAGEMRRDAYALAHARAQTGPFGALMDLSINVHRFVPRPPSQRSETGGE